MKYRNGFVSNSSTSSFIITTSEELTVELLISYFGVDKSSPLYGISKQIADYINEKSTRYKDIQDYVRKNNYYECEDEIPMTILAALKSRKCVAIFECSNEYDNPISALIYYGGDIECETPQITIKNEWSC